MKSKEAILEQKQIVFLSYSDENSIFEAMSEYAQQQSIAYHKWTSDKGYLPRLHPERNEWGWKRQVNQIIWSDWISNDELYALFIEHQNTTNQ